VGYTLGIGSTLVRDSFGVSHQKKVSFVECKKFSPLLNSYCKGTVRVYNYKGFSH